MSIQRFLGLRVGPGAVRKQMAHSPWHRVWGTAEDGAVPCSSWQPPSSHSWSWGAAASSAGRQLCAEGSPAGSRPFSILLVVPWKLLLAESSWEPVGESMLLNGSAPENSRQRHGGGGGGGQLEDCIAGDTSRFLSGFQPSVTALRSPTPPWDTPQMCTREQVHANTPRSPLAFCNHFSD